MSEPVDSAAPFALPARSGQRERYRRVIDATIKLAGEGGYDGVQMRSVAERSGVALGTVYSYFSSRDNLVFRAMVLWSLDVVTRAYTSSPAEDADDLEADVIHLLQLHADQPRLLDAFVRAGLTLDSHAMAARREILHSWWVGSRPNFEVLGPDLAKVAPQVLNDAFYAAAVRWAYGELTLAEVIERTRTAVRVLLLAARSPRT